MAGVQQQLQQKPESVASDAHSELDRGLEDFVCGDYGECMSFASCSLPRTTTTEARGNRLEGGGGGPISMVMTRRNLLQRRGGSR
ncbi:RING/U-box superfamily protein [Salvia divinorum]|uniref:RING/U-box superfamily protein n=1 Tax=Salvia divinorum TaxID=28513 RepID=A0ABD1HD58_SALDI